jgi:hypothetical protein
MVEAAGVEPDNATENMQLIGSQNTGNRMIFTITNLAVQSLYSLLPELPELPNFHPWIIVPVTKRTSEVRI